MKTTRLSCQLRFIQIATGQTGVAYVLFFVMYCVRDGHGGSETTHAGVTCIIDGIGQASEPGGYMSAAAARELCREHEAQASAVSFSDAELAWRTEYIGQGAP